MNQNYQSRIFLKCISSPKGKLALKLLMKLKIPEGLITHFHAPFPNSMTFQRFTKECSTVTHCLLHQLCLLKAKERIYQMRCSSLHQNYSLQLETSISGQGCQCCFQKSQHTKKQTGSSKIQSTKRRFPIGRPPFQAKTW